MSSVSQDKRYPFHWRSDVEIFPSCLGVEDEVDDLCHCYRYMTGEELLVYSTDLMVDYWSKVNIFLCKIIIYTIIILNSPLGVTEDSLVASPSFF